VMTTTVGPVFVPWARRRVGFSAGTGAAYGTNDILTGPLPPGCWPEPATAGFFALAGGVGWLGRRTLKRR